MISVTLHERRLRQQPCIVSQLRPVTLHHTHGGSMKDHGWHVGVGQRQNPYLQLPLHAHYHTGGMGIDSGMGVLTWERTFGTQWELLEKLDEELNYGESIFTLARSWQEEHRQSSFHEGQ